MMCTALGHGPATLQVLALIGRIYIHVTRVVVLPSSGENSFGSHYLSAKPI